MHVYSTLLYSDWTATVIIVDNYANICQKVCIDEECTCSQNITQNVLTTVSSKNVLDVTIY